MKSVYELNVDEIEQMLADKPKKDDSPIAHVIIEPELKQINKLANSVLNTGSMDTNSDVVLMEEPEEILKIKTQKNKKLIYCSKKDKNELLFISKKKNMGLSRTSRKRKQLLFKEVLDEIDLKKHKKW